MTKNCFYCGNPFELITSHQKYCIGCQKYAYRKKYREYSKKQSLNPKYKEWKKKWNKEYNSKPEVKWKKNLYARKHPDICGKWSKEHPEERKQSRERYDSIHRGYSEEFFMIKYQVKARDKNTCVYCGEKDRSTLVVHHKDRNKLNNNMNNLITLCRRCHGIEHRLDYKRKALEDLDFSTTNVV